MLHHSVVRPFGLTDKTDKQRDIGTSGIDQEAQQKNVVVERVSLGKGEKIENLILLEQLDELIQS